MRARPSPFAVFGRRSFTLLWLGQFVSTAGSGLTSIAASILVYRETGTAASVGLVMIATAVPSLFVGLVAGVFVDRFDRKRIMVATEVLRALLVASVPVLLDFGVAWLYVLIVLSSAVGQFFEPAQTSVLPEVASEEELAAANSMMAISNVGAMSIGFAAAGLLATAFSAEWAFYVDAVTFAVSAMCILSVTIRPLVTDEQTNVASVVRHLRAGLGFVRETDALRSMFVLFVVIGLAFGLWNSLVLPFVSKVLDGSELEYGIFEGLSTIGFVGGSLAMASLGDRLHEGQWIAISIVGMGLGGIAFGLSTDLWVALGFFVLIGVLNAPSYISRGLIIQRNTPREVRGRVASAFAVTRDIAFMIGMAMAGLADLAGIRALVVTCGGVLLAIGFVAAAIPGLGQPTAEWRRTIAMLRSPQEAPGLGLGRGALAADLARLAVHLPAYGGMSLVERQALARQLRVFEAPAGVSVVGAGDASTAAYFLLDGRTVASRDGRILEVHNGGDFVGEIAALTGTPRTADVVTERPTTLLQVPAPVLRRLMDDPAMQRLLLSKMTERLVRLDLLELPRMVGLDQSTLRELRTPDPEPAAMEAAAAT
jgi:MFS family permease